MVSVLAIGLLVGLGSAAVGMGLWISYGRQHFVDLVNAGFLLVSAYGVYELTRAGLDPILAGLVLIPAGAVVGFCFYLLLLDRFRFRAHLESALFTFGALFVLEGLLLYIWHGDLRTITTDYLTVGHQVAGLSIPTNVAVAAAAGVLLTVVVYAIFRYTSFGRLADAVCADADRAASLGIDVRLTNAALYALATACAIVGGLVISISVPFYPNSVLQWFVVAFIVATLGGPFGPWGILIAAVLLQLFQVVVGYYFGGWEMIATFGGLLLILVARPRFLFADAR